MPDLANPLIVQSDRSALLEVDNPKYEECRDSLAAFAELIKSPEHFHTYKITPLSLWNARAAGMSVSDVLAALSHFSKYEVPGNVLAEIREYAGRFGRLKLHNDSGSLILEADDPFLALELWHHKQAQKIFIERLGERAFRLHLLDRGRLKQTLIKAGFPVEDLAGYVEGERLDFDLRQQLASGTVFALRQYQLAAADVFWAGGGAQGGSGVLVLPCGAGKTVIAMEIMARARTSTLILTTGQTASNQWKRELLDKTTLTEREIGLYAGDQKEICPVTLATYQIMTYRRRGGGQEPGARSQGGEFGTPDTGPRTSEDDFVHLRLFNERDWGLIVYDEVHLLPAPVFRITAEIQAKRRLGLTATLVREDHREDDVFSLIGPKKADVPWRVLEKQGWIATAVCHEVRLPLDEDLRLAYAIGDPSEKFRLSSCNPLKIDAMLALLDRHAADRVLVIGQFLDQLQVLAERTGVPLITGKTPTRERDRLYEEFRQGRLGRLIVSKVANFAIDLPEANVAIQVSGTFGSRQEEAQRLGRILRPKQDGGQAHFYALVTRETRDQEFAMNRQLFLTEQGYEYQILDWLDAGADTNHSEVGQEALPPNVIPMTRRQKGQAS